MQRLNILENHFASQALAVPQDPTLTGHLVEKYRKMSTLEPGVIQKFMFHVQDLELSRKFEEIFKDKQLFANETQEEDSRAVKREKGNTRILRILKEAAKIMPLKDIFNDFVVYGTFTNHLYIYDEVICTKFFVNFGLYHKTIVNLGTEQHEKYKKNCEDCIDFGCFGLTELGHGSNVRGIETTAHYDKTTKQFIINTPTDTAMKFWIGGAGKTSNISAIFAQLYIGDKCYGPHAFIVPIRDKNTHYPFPGIILGDCGKKQGLDGIDNGFMIFNHVRIPRENMLNRFSNVTEDGEFQSLIENSESRFAFSLASISNGRLFMIQAPAMGLLYSSKIALRFAAMRTQFGQPGQKESSLIEYQTHQNRLFPIVANGMAYLLASQKITKLWGKNQKHLLTPGNRKLAELHSLISSLKALASWDGPRGVQECRKACGGLGYSFYSRFSIIMNNMEVNQTWEGDNNVLLQQTAKFLLDLFKQKMKGKLQKKTITCEWIKTEPVQGDKCLAETEEHIVVPQCLIDILEFRANLLLQRSGLALSEKLQNKVNPIEAWNDTQVFFLQNLATAYSDLFVVREFIDQINAMQEGNEDTKECLTLLCKLDALRRIQNDIGIWLEAEYLNGNQSQLVREAILTCLKGLKKHMIALSYALPPGEDFMDSMLAPQDGELYKSVISRIYAAPQVFERIGNWRELYAKDQ